MKREDWLAKGYTEEQVTDLLNTFHKFYLTIFTKKNIFFICSLSYF